MIKVQMCAMVMLLVATLSPLSKAAVLTATEDGNLLATLDSADNTLLVKIGENDPVDILDELVETKRASAENSAEIEAGARDARASVENNAACDAALVSVTGDVADLVKEVAKPADTSTADGLLLDMADSMEAAHEALATLTSVLNATVIAEAEAAAAAADAAAAAAAPQPSLSVSLAIHPAGGCGGSKATACSAAYHTDDMSSAGAVAHLLTRSSGGAFYDMEGIYECAYKLSTTKKVVTAPALLLGGGTSGRVECPPPLQDPENTKDSTWSATVTLLEVGSAVPNSDVNGETVSDAVVWFSSEGPIIHSIAHAGLGEGNVISLSPADLDGDSKVKITFKVADRDTDLDDVDVSVAVEKEKTKFITGAEILDRDGEVQTTELTFDQDFEGDTEAVITVTAKDDHDRTVTKSFKVVLAPIYSAFWATLEADDDIDNSNDGSAKSNHYIVGGKDRKKWEITDDLDDGTFKIGDDLDLDTGIYTVPKDGLYMVNAMVRIDKSSGQFKLFINIKHPGITSAKKAVQDIHSQMKSTYNTLKLATTFKLEAGDELTVDLQVWHFNSFRIQYETGWGVALVPDAESGNTPDGSMWRPIQNTNPGDYYTIHMKDAETWDVEAKVSLYGTFHYDGFNKDNSQYTIQEDGIYRINMQLRADQNRPWAGANGQWTTLVTPVHLPACCMKVFLVVNYDNNYPPQGVTATDCDLYRDAKTMSVGGIVYLGKGWKVQMGFSAYEAQSADWAFMDTSTFSVVRIGAKDTPGFHAILGTPLGNLAAAGSCVGGWNGIGWMYTGKAGLASATGATTDTAKMAFDNGGFELENKKNHFTQFTCQVAGVYAVEANLQYKDASGDYFRLIVAKNVGDPCGSNNADQINAYMNAGMHAIKGKANSDSYSLSISGFMIMAKGDTANLMAFGTHRYDVPNGHNGVYYNDARNPNKNGGGGFSMALIHAL